MSNATWLDTNTAAERLGISPQKLRRMHREGWLKFGIHVRSKSPASALKQHMQFNIEKLEALFSTERRFWKNYAKG